MYEFLRGLWVMKSITTEQIKIAVIKKILTQEQADFILALPQNSGI